jgi:hypothetical protein
MEVPKLTKNDCIFQVGVPLLATHQFVSTLNPHCSLLIRCQPWEASSAWTWSQQPIFRREQWHTLDTSI